MKIFFFNLLVFCFLNFGLNAQNSPIAPLECNNPISNAQFQQKRNLILDQNNDIRQLEVAKRIARNNCLLSQQVKAIAEIFVNDFDRLEFCRTAYPNTFDKANFYEVYDCFAYFSNVFRLHDYVNGFRNNVIVQPPIIREPIVIDPPIIDPILEDPPCFVDNEDFLQIKQSIEKQRFNNTKITIAKQIIRTKQCFSCNQIKQIVSLFDFETSKLTMAKFCYDFCTDPDNYYLINDVFDYESSRTDLAEFLENR